MKLLRVGVAGSEKPAAVDAGGKIRDLSDHIEDIDGRTLGDNTIDRLRKLDLTSLPLLDDGERIGPCVGSVGKMICIGLNYSDHAEESGLEVPPAPVIFFKATSAICGPNDSIMIPRDSTALDWEVELAIVIGRDGSYIEESEATDYIAGYCVVNDVSERNFQIHRSGQWVKGKSADTFGPMGPWMVTRDEVPNPQDLRMHLEVNGEVRQNGSTATMVYQVPFLVSYVSKFMSLQAGDVISTGTPPGVGMGMKPPQYLGEGDVVTLEIDGLGAQRQQVRA
jgi:2-keto-4-pentenoate hydratase/2-oxohepta-3-ene-1,7-dioic acid hydratase in catechol pathway